jgi:hypothetical protein
MGVSDVPNLKQVAEKWVNNRDTYYDKIFSAIDGIHNRTWAENKFEELGLEKFANGGDVNSPLLYIEEVESKIGRKLNSWHDDVVSIGSLNYKKVYLKPFYKIIN